MTIKELKKLLEQYKQEAEDKIPRLIRIADEAGRCSDSEFLGHAEGYAQALKEILSKI